MRAFEQHQLHQPEAPAAVWEDLRSHLAGALDSLSGTDREAVLLRFYRQASHRDVAAALRVSAKRPPRNGSTGRWRNSAVS